MRNKLKSDTVKTPKKANKKGGLKKLIAPATTFLKDERFLKIVGLWFILTSAYLLIAFISFLFTWKTDQDKLTDSWWTLITNPDLKVENWLGKFGAIISHQFIHDWFGVSSFVFVALFFLVGFRILFKFSILPLRKTFKHALFNMVWSSVFLGYLFHKSLYFLGGSFGYHINNWLISLFGKVGTGFLLVFVLIGFGVLTFNISFEWVKGIFEKKVNNAIEEEDIDYSDSLVGVKLAEETKVVKTVIPELDKEEDLKTEELELGVDLGISLTEEKATPSAMETMPLEVEEHPLEVETIENGLENVSGAGEVDLSTTIPESTPFEANHNMAVEDTTAISDTLPDKEVEKSLEEFGEYDPTLDLGTYQNPPLDLLVDHGDGKVKVTREELENYKNKIVETLGHYKIEISKIKATIGPTVTLYEIVPAPGVRISKIKNLEDDIALSIAAMGIRIIAPIPGKGTIGIEVPNQSPDVVSMRTVIASEKFQNADMELPIAFGKTIQNETYVVDLAKMPHLLMAGATGQGKSVGLNCILVSLLYKKHPAQVKFVLVDPKKVELTLFNKIERHFLAKLPDEAEAIITDTQKVVHTLNSLCIEMDQRYDILKNAHCRNIKEYNTKFISRKLNPNNGHRFLPYIVLVIDEFADLIMTAGKEVEVPIARLAQLARAIGIHLIVATQRPSVNVITGMIKANFPARAAFKVTNKIDSRTILDAGGADQLIGRGDMLISLGNEIVRLQCAFVDTPEVEAITDFIGEQRGYPDAFLLPEYVDENATQSSEIAIADRDSLFEDAARVVIMNQSGSTSLIQRKMKLGYNRAGRIMDQLEDAGIVGPSVGSKAREVLFPDEYSLEQFLNGEQ